MYRSALTSIAALLIALGSCGVLRAQANFRDVTKPPSDAGGHAGQEMRSVYQADVGQGYSISSLNSIALQNARAHVPYVGQSSAGARAPGGNIGLGLGPSRSSKPFSSLSTSPTVSPYLNLFREDFSGSSDFNYQTLVRPQLQQQQVNQQLERQNLELSRRVQAISAQSAYQNPAGSEQQHPTGHQTVFGYYGRFYPGKSAQARR